MSAASGLKWLAAVLLGAAAFLLPPDGHAWAESWQDTMRQAIAAHQRGNLERAEDRLRAALAEAKAFEPPDQRLAESHLGLASVLTDLGRFDEARQALDNAVPLYETLFGRDSRQATMAVNAKAIVEMRDQRFAEATPLLHRVLASLEAERGAGHRALAPILDSLAAAQLGLADYEASAGYAARALAIREAALGASHPDLVTNLEAYAIALRLSGKSEAADALEARAAAIEGGGSQ